LEPLAWHWSHWSSRLVNRGGEWLFPQTFSTAAFVSLPRVEKSLRTDRVAGSLRGRPSNTDQYHPSEEETQTNTDQYHPSEEETQTKEETQTIEHRPIPSERTSRLPTAMKRGGGGAYRWRWQRRPRGAATSLPTPPHPSFPRRHPHPLANSVRQRRGQARTKPP